MPLESVRRKHQLTEVEKRFEASIRLLEYTATTLSKINPDAIQTYGVKKAYYEYQGMLEKIVGFERGLQQNSSTQVYTDRLKAVRSMLSDWYQKNHILLDLAKQSR